MNADAKGSIHVIRFMGITCESTKNATPIKIIAGLKKRIMPKNCRPHGSYQGKLGLNSEVKTMNEDQQRKRKATVRTKWMSFLNIISCSFRDNNQVIIPYTIIEHD